MANDPAGDVPDCVLLPTQCRRYTTDSPARRLAVAVLALAVADVQHRGAVSYGNGKGAATRDAWRARMSAEALAWFAADDGAWPYSFTNLCAVLHLDPDGVRRALAGRRAA